MFPQVEGCEETDPNPIKNFLTLFTLNTLPVLFLCFFSFYLKKIVLMVVFQLSSSLHSLCFIFLELLTFLIS